jgi:DnaK suppressor protein
MALNQQQLDKMRARLNGMLEDLENEVSTTLDGMRKGSGAFPDPTDRATMESERNLTLRIRDRERKLRNKIEDALARIEAGTFGICEVCEETIGFARLEARPVTTLCINCKSEQEQDEEKHQSG